MARSDARHRVLFVCTGNSTRSILAEAILRREGGDRFEAHSAGIRPRAVPSPQVLALLRQAGHDVSPLRCKSVAEMRQTPGQGFDFVLTVCNRAANEDCPAWPGMPLAAHWGISGMDGTARALHAAHDALQARIRAFVRLPMHGMDRLALQRALDDIGQGRVPT